MQKVATPKNPLLGRPRFNFFGTRAQCSHGPQVWPWWKWIAFRLSHLSVCLPSTGRVIWLYTRWGAISLGMTIDRRGMIYPEGRGW